MESYYVEARICYSGLKQGEMVLHVYPGRTEHGYRSEPAKHAREEGYRRFLDDPFRQARRDHES